MIYLEQRVIIYKLTKETKVYMIITIKGRNATMKKDELIQLSNNLRRKYILTYFDKLNDDTNIVYTDLIPILESKKIYKLLGSFKAN